jgi:general secretion pathway protein M
MSISLRATFSAIGVAAVVALGFGSALFAALSLISESSELVTLCEQSAALQGRERRLPAPSVTNPLAAVSFEAKTITLAGAALQQRIEEAITGAKGRLISSGVDVESHAAERRIVLAAELSIAESELQSLLYDLEIGRPYVFVDSFEARASESASEDGHMRVSLSLSGYWGAPE